MRFTRFACFDWSGAAVERPTGIALAIAGAQGSPRLVERRWSRADALGWLRDAATAGEPMLVGVDFSLALPFTDAGAYFPGWPGSPPDAPALWALVDGLGTDDPHLGAAGVLRHRRSGATSASTAVGAGTASATAAAGDCASSRR